MKSTLLVASALALPMFCSSAIAGDEFRALNGLNGTDGAAAVSMSDAQLSSIDGNGTQTATATGGAGGAGGAGGVASNLANVNLGNCAMSNCTGNGSGSQSNHASANGGNGGNGGDAVAVNKRGYYKKYYY